MRQTSSHNVSYLEGMICRRKLLLNRRSKYQESFPWGFVGVGGMKIDEETSKRAGLATLR